MKFKKALFVLFSLSTCLAAHVYAAEDCVPFNTANTNVQFVGGEWKIVDGSHWMFSFGNKEAEAKRALQIIKTYHMAQSCFVGRPGPSFWYLLQQSGAAPRGNLLRGEDCIPFHPAKVRIEFIASSHTYKMVEGNMWMEDFGDKKQEAYEALEIVKKHRFNEQCFVGRPGPSFRYWKSTPPFAEAEAGAEVLE